MTPLLHSHSDVIPAVLLFPPPVQEITGNGDSHPPSCKGCPNGLSSGVFALRKCDPGEPNLIQAMSVALFLELQNKRCSFAWLLCPLAGASVPQVWRWQLGNCAAGSGADVGEPQRHHCKVPQALRLSQGSRGTPAQSLQGGMMDWPCAAVTTPHQWLFALHLGHTGAAASSSG